MPDPDERASSPRSPHVEVIGLPGAGKTTLLDRLVTREIRGPLRIGRPPDPSRLATVVAKGRLLGRLVLRTGDASWLVAHRDPGLRWLMDKHAFRWAGFDGLDDGNPLVLADAGFLEPFVTRATYHGPLDRRREAALLGLVPRPTGIIHVTCDTAVAHARFVRRERALDRLPQGLSSETLRRNFDVAGDVCHRIERWARERSIATIRIDGTDEPTEAELDRLLLEVLSSTR